MFTDKPGFLYLIRNTMTHDFYIGVTVKPPEMRFKQHVQSAKRGTYEYRLHRAIRKYGEDAFSVETIGQFSTKKEAIQLEIETINRLKPTYNMTNGGDSVEGLPRTPEWLAKMSAAHKGKKKSPELREMAVKALEKARAARHRSIVCLNDNTIFPSIKSAAVHYGLSRRGIGEVLACRQYFVSNMAFAYIGDDTALTVAERHAKRHVKKQRLGKSRRRPIKHIETGKVFESGVAAAEAFRISPTAICHALNKGKFAYLEK